MALLKNNDPGELRFIRNSSIFGKMSTAVHRANVKPEPDGLWFTLSSGAQIRTEDVRVMSGKSGSTTSDLQARAFDPARRRVVHEDLTGRDWLFDG